MSSPNTPPEVESLNFEEIGVRWTTRALRGERHRFASLRSLREALADGRVSQDDEISFDGALWRPIRDIPDLRAYFWEVFKGIQQGRIQPSTLGIIGGDDSLLEEDAPTTFIRPSQALQANLARDLAAQVLAKNLPPSPPPTAPHPLPNPSSSPPPAPAQRRGSGWVAVVVGGAVAAAVLVALVLLLTGLWLGLGRG